MPTILRSSAVGKLRLGSTTTVPSPRASGSRAGYRAAKVRWNSSEGARGGANDIAKDNQSPAGRTPPVFLDRQVLPGRRRPVGRCRHHGPMTQATSFYEGVGGDPTFRRRGAGFYRRGAA